MKNLLYLICLVATLGFTSCSSNDSEPVVKPSQTGTMTDKDGNEYQWVRIGSLDWMASNLKCGTPYYDLMTTDYWGDYTALVEINNKANTLKQYATFGNYYTYDEAVANAPAGWRLPTDDDWKALEKELGVSNIDELGWRDGGGYLIIQTLEQGTGLNLRYGGELCHFGYGTESNIKECHVYDYGMYWTSTKDTTMVEESAFFRKVMPYHNQIERNSAATAYRYCNVRYVRDAQ